MKLTFAISLALITSPQVQAQAAEPTIPVESTISGLSEPLNQPIVFRAPPTDIGEPQGKEKQADDSSGNNPAKPISSIQSSLKP